MVRSEAQGLRFKWSDPVTAAAFNRGPYVFLVFNKRAALDLSAVRTPPPEDLVGEITQVPSEGTTLRLAPPPNTYYAIRSEGHEWVVELTRRPRRPDAPADIATRNENDPAAARVLVTLRGGQAVMTQRDPEVGAEMKIVPTALAGAGVEDEHDFPQFRILSSAQGLVVLPEADGVVVRPLGPVIEIFSQRGLMVSSPETVPVRSDPNLDPEPMPRLFNFREWSRDDGRPYHERKREVERALSEVITEGPRGRRREVELDARRLGHEAIRRHGFEPLARGHERAGVNLDAVNNRRVKRENSFHTDSGRNFTNGERGVCCSPFFTDDNSLKSLNTLFFTLPDFNIDRNCIARREFRMIKPNLFFFDFLNNLHNIPQNFFHLLAAPMCLQGRCFVSQSIKVSLLILFFRKCPEKFIKYGTYPISDDPG